MKNIHDVIKGPCMTEKSSLIAESKTEVVLKVDPRANKLEVRRAVEQMFNVKVGTVRTATVRGKRRRVGMKSVGTTASWKKAYVSLTEGEINLREEL